MNNNFQQSKTQVLITGVYRTGSEYVTIMLNKNLYLHASMYKVNALRFMYDKYGKNGKIDTSKLIMDFFDRYDRRYTFDFSKEEFDKIIRSYSNSTYGDIYDRIMTFLYLGEKTCWAEKCQLLWREIPLFINSMRNGWAIHIYRDPRSVLASFKLFTNSLPPLYLITVFNCLDSFQFISKKKSKERVINVRFEDFVKNTRGELSLIFDKLNLSNVIDENAREVDVYGKKWKINSSYNSDPRSKDKWKEILSKKEISLVEAVCGEEMDKFGYDRVNCNDSFSDLFDENTKLKNIFKNWEFNGKGIEQFPNDPFDSSTWEKEIIKHE